MVFVFDCWFICAFCLFDWLVYLVLWNLEIGLYCFGGSDAVVAVTISVVWLVRPVLVLLV